MFRLRGDFLYIFIIMVAISSCSFNRGQTVDEDPNLNGLLTVDISFAHQLKIGALVERFYVEDEVIWHQCGRVKPGADLLASLTPDSLFFVYPNIELNQKKETRLDGDEQKKLRYLVLKAIDVVSSSPNLQSPVKISNFNQGILDAQLSLGNKWSFARRSFETIKSKEQESDRTIMDLLEAFESLKMNCN